MGYRFFIDWCDHQTYEVHAFNEDIEVVCLGENRRPASEQDALAILAHAIIKKAREGKLSAPNSSWWRDDGVNTHAQAEIETRDGKYQIYASTFNADMSSAMIEVSRIHAETMTQIVDDSRTSPIAAYLNIRPQNKLHD